MKEFIVEASSDYADRVFRTIDIVVVDISSLYFFTASVGHSDSLLAELGFSNIFFFNNSIFSTTILGSISPNFRSHSICSTSSRDFLIKGDKIRLRIL